MTERSRVPFNHRAFTALAAAASALGLAVTGLGIHAGHSEAGAASGHAWMATHMLLAAIFVACGTWHAVLNGRVLVRHAVGARGRLAGVTREAAWAAAVVALALGLAIGHGMHPH